MKHCDSHLVTHHVFDKGELRHLRSPARPDASLTFSDDGNAIVADGKAVGRVFEEEKRIEWALELDDGLEARIAQERASYDDWAKRIRQRSPGRPRTVGARWHDDQLYAQRAFEELVREWPAVSSVAGERVLDVGGSLIDSWRFLRRDAAHVDQVEVSSESQRLALHRLESMGLSSDAITFHTAPAEQLPFQDGVFDFVFSRATLHHTRRPDSFREIARVLKPGGIMLAREPRMSWPVHALMRTVRVLRRVDRGTDDPLRAHELRQLAPLFGHAQVYSWGFGAFLLEQMGAPRRLTKPLERLEDRIGRIPAVTRLLGEKSWLVAQKTA